MDPPEAARVLAAILVLLLFIGLLRGVVTDVLLRGANNAFSTGRRTQGPKRHSSRRCPAVPTRSSRGPRSAATGDFVAGGPTISDLRRFNGRAPTQPIRVYVGVDSAPSPRARSALAVRELERTGAFAREVLCVITATGEGWIDPRTVDPLEYMYNGDSALVALQYSYLPSWISFLVDRDRTVRSGV